MKLRPEFKMHPNLILDVLNTHLNVIDIDSSADGYIDWFETTTYSLIHTLGILFEDFNFYLTEDNVKMLKDSCAKSTNADGILKNYLTPFELGYKNNKFIFINEPDYYLVIDGKKVFNIQAYTSEQLEILILQQRSYPEDCVIIPLDKLVPETYINKLIEQKKSAK